MLYYLQLQLQFFKRRFEQAGFNFFLAVLLLCGLLCGLSYLLYQKTAFAGLILGFMALSFCWNLARKVRTEFLQMTFRGTFYKKIRLVENLLITAPFLIEFAIYLDWIALLGTLSIAIILSQLSLSKMTHFVVPTPYGKNPFEFLLGFRKYFWIVPIGISLILIGWKYENFNLSIVAYAAIGLLTLQFHGIPENEHYVWNEAKNTKQFLNAKLLLSSKQLFVWLVIPLVTMVLLFPKMYLFIFLAYACVQLFSWTIIAAKYARFPNEITFVDMLLIAFCLGCPPLLIPLFIYFYRTANQSLSYYLK